MNLIVVGDGADRLSAPTRVQAPAPREQTVGLRRKLVHEYFGMRIDRLWITASRNAPDLPWRVAAWLERP